MTEPDEALLWAREDYAEAFRRFKPHISEEILQGKWDGDGGVRLPAHGYRAGAAASAARIKELEGAVRSLIGIIKVNGLLQDPIWIHRGAPKRQDGRPVFEQVAHARRAVNEARALLKETDQ